MADFTDIVALGDAFEQARVEYKGRNFEELYTELCAKPQLASVREDLESVVFAYFSSLVLPPQPTLYDHLVLALRKKDVIATFNWDPFLLQAIRRNQIVRGDIPSVLFLHGNVSTGYCRRDEMHGVRGSRCSRCGEPFEASRLLYPVTTKSYDDDPSIADAWRMAKAAFKAAFMVTVFTAIRRCRDSITSGNTVRLTTQ